MLSFWENNETKVILNLLRAPYIKSQILKDEWCDKVQLIFQVKFETIENGFLSIFNKIQYYVSLDFAMSSNKSLEELLKIMKIGH